MLLSRYAPHDALQVGPPHGALGWVKRGNIAQCERIEHGMGRYTASSLVNADSVCAQARDATNLPNRRPYDLCHGGERGLRRDIAAGAGAHLRATAKAGAGMETGVGKSAQARLSRQTGVGRQAGTGHLQAYPDHIGVAIAKCRTTCTLYPPGAARHRGVGADTGAGKLPGLRRARDGGSAIDCGARSAPDGCCGKQVGLCMAVA